MARIHRRIVPKQKGLNDPENHVGVVTHLEPDTLKCEVKLCLKNYYYEKGSGGDEIPAKLF